ncbi:caspase family protein [Sessilibacter corallicola]|uniref:caspase family protein n=1 Tax=Sessilibacter corallicola TaxID=2904075 RepID=UPI001E2DC91E|nr:caspase family protein [Sessilibacter corallicola]MCE2029791.1 caspase family protein [Sessilibacter corallicola]
MIGIMAMYTIKNARFMLACCFVLFSPWLKAQPLQVGEFHALLIANQNYEYWDNLNTPFKDVDKISSILRNRYGFNTKIIKDASSADIIDAIDEYRSTLSSRDNFLLYYAGHGEVRADSSYWVGVNGRRNTSGNWVDLNRINSLIDSDSGMRARHVLVIADSCFSGHFFRGNEQFFAPLNTDSLAWHQAQIRTTSRTAFTSGANEPVLDRASNQSTHSVFAQELIRRLNNQHSVISAGKLHNLIEKDVFARARRANQVQSPQYGSISGTGHSGGDFVFIPQNQRTAFIHHNTATQSNNRNNTRGNNSSTTNDRANAIRISGLNAEKQTLLDNCNNGNTSDCVSLGYDFDIGDGVPQNYTKASELYLKGCEGGEARGCTNLGVLYEKGRGVTQNYTKARDLYLKGCEGGEARGCTNLGVLYEKGRGVTQNYTKARDLYLKGCEGGNAYGCTNLGVLYEKGRGVTQNYTKARELYLKGCEGGNVNGCTNLGYLYDEGRGVTQNYTKARDLYLKGCEGGEARGCTNLGFLYYEGLGVTQNYTKAGELYLKGCEGGSSIGCNNLGINYEFGNGVDKDLVKSLSFYQKACNLGHEKACNKLN